MQPRRPARSWYALPVAAFAALVVHVVLGVVALLAGLDAAPRARMPGTASLELAAGDATLFYEAAPGTAGSVSTTLRCALAGPDGSPIELDTAAGSTTYSVGQHRGHSVFDVDIVIPGRHVLTCETDDDRPFLMAAVPAIGGRLLSFFVTLGLLLAATIAGVAIIAHLRYRNRHLVPGAIASRPSPPSP